MLQERKPITPMNETEREREIEGQREREYLHGKDDGWGIQLF